MLIRYKLIENERLGDAPFCGALISAIDCNFNCKNCFNQKIKNLPTLIDNTENIIKRIKENKFNKGIILAGLEWTNQYEEAIALALRAKFNNLMTMLYTGHTFNWFNANPNALLLFDYIKCGQYQEATKTANHIEYGVVLSSSNQRIYKKGVDY